MVTPFTLNPSIRILMYLLISFFRSRSCGWRVRVDSRRGRTDNSQKHWHLESFMEFPYTNSKLYYHQWDYKYWYTVRAIKQRMSVESGLRALLGDNVRGKVKYFIRDLKPSSVRTTVPVSRNSSPVLNRAQRFCSLEKGDLRWLKGDFKTEEGSVMSVWTGKDRSFSRNLSVSITLSMTLRFTRRDFRVRTLFRKVTKWRCVFGRKG